MSNQGWIKLHRKILQNPILSDPYFLKLWIYCLLKASHQDGQQLVGNQLVEIKRGQFITGRKALFRDFNNDIKPSKQISESTLWRMLLTLESTQMLNIKKTNKYSIVTVTNWITYQQNEQIINTNRNVKNTSLLDFSDSDMENAKLLFKYMKENNPKIKEPNFEKWANDFRLIRERDKHTDQEVKRLIHWTQQDDFWKSNILSPNKLRKQWDSLILRSSIKRSTPTQQPKDTRDKEIEFQQWITEGNDPDEFRWN